MENWTLNADIVTIVKYLGYTECTIEDKINWIGCKTVERLERMDSEYIPLYKKNKSDVLFPDSADMLLDWDKLIEIANEFGIETVPTDRNKMIIILAETIKKGI